MGESGGCVSHGHLDKVKILRAFPGLEEIRGWKQEAHVALCSNTQAISRWKG